MSDSALATPLMATASANDPFYTMRDVCEGELNSVSVSFEQWQQLLRSTDTATDMTFKTAHTELGARLEKMATLTSKLNQACVFVERNPAKFPHVDARELTARKQIAAALVQRAVRMKETYNGRDTKAKMEGDVRRQMHARTVADQEAATRRTNTYTTANSAYIADQEQAQATIRAQQDQSLTKISSTLDTIGDMAKAINDEIVEQDKIITDTDREVDTAQGKMDQALAGIQKLLKTKDNCQLATICILVVVFIIVAVIAFYVLTG